MHRMQKDQGTSEVPNMASAIEILLLDFKLIKYEVQSILFGLLNSNVIKPSVCALQKYFTNAAYCKYGVPNGDRIYLWNKVIYWKPKDLCKKDCGHIFEGTLKMDLWTTIDPIFRISNFYNFQFFSGIFSITPASSQPPFALQPLPPFALQPLPAFALLPPFALQPFAL